MAVKTNEAEAFLMRFSKAGKLAFFPETKARG